MSNKEFNWTDKLVLEFSKLSTKGSYGIFENAKNLKDKLKIYKMMKSKLLSKNTAIVSLSDITNNGFNLSAEFNINKLKNKNPYIIENGIYVPAKSHQITKAEYFNQRQLKHINNLLIAITEINKEIERIKSSDEFDEKIKESKLSNRAKNSCYKLIGKKINPFDAMLSDVAVIPVSNWRQNMGMGEKTFKEIKRYLTNNGFTLIIK